MGPYRDEDVLLTLHSYLSKYLYRREAFYMSCPSFHPATAQLMSEAQAGPSLASSPSSSSRANAASGSSRAGSAGANEEEHARYDGQQRQRHDSDGYVGFCFFTLNRTHPHGSVIVKYTDGACYPSARRPRQH